MQKILLFIATLCSVALLNATPSFADTLTFDEVTNNSKRPFIEVNGPYNYLYVFSAEDSEGREINLSPDTFKAVHDGNTRITYSYIGDVRTLKFTQYYYQKVGSDAYSQFSTPYVWKGLSTEINLYTSNGMLNPVRTNLTIYKKDDTVFFYRLMNLEEVLPEVQKEEKIQVMRLVGSSARSLVISGIGLLALLITLWLLVKVLRQSLKG